MQTNIRIREAMLRTGLKQWQVAEIIGVTEETMSRKMRYELSDKEQDNIIILIEAYTQKRGE